MTNNLTPTPVHPTYDRDNVTSLELANVAMEAALDKKATDVMAVNVGPYLVLVDYFVIATGSSDRQVSAIVDEIERRLREDTGRKPLGRESDARATWVLLDFGDIVVHVFQPEARDEYRLEKLWGEAKRIRPTNVPAPDAAAAAGDAAPEVAAQ